MFGIDAHIEQEGKLLDGHLTGGAVGQAFLVQGINFFRQAADIPSLDVFGFKIDRFTASIDSPQIGLEVIAVHVGHQRREHHLAQALGFIGLFFQP